MSINGVFTTVVFIENQTLIYTKRCDLMWFYLDYFMPYKNIEIIYPIKLKVFTFSVVVVAFPKYVHFLILRAKNIHIVNILVLRD